MISGQIVKQDGREGQKHKNRREPQTVKKNHENFDYPKL